MMILEIQIKGMNNNTDDDDNDNVDMNEVKECNKQLQQTGKERVQEKVWLNGESDSQGIVRVIKVWSHRRMIHAQTRNCYKKDHP